MRAADVFCGSTHNGLIVPAQSLKGLCNVNQQYASRIVHWGHISTKYISTPPALVLQNEQPALKRDIVYLQWTYSQKTLYADLAVC